MYYSSISFYIDIADEGTWKCNPKGLDQPADVWEWLNTLGQEKHDAIASLTINSCMSPPGSKVRLEGETNGEEESGGEGDAEGNAESEHDRDETQEDNEGGGEDASEEGEGCDDEDDAEEDEADDEDG